LKVLEETCMIHSPSIHLNLVGFPDGLIGAAIGVWNLREAYEIDVAHIRERWSAAELAPTDSCTEADGQPRDAPLTLGMTEGISDASWIL
jgi:hypothetical protein